MVYIYSRNSSQRHGSQEAFELSTNISTTHCRERELIESISVLSLSEPSSLMFPEGLENEFELTEMTPLAVLLSAGVNVAE